MRQLPSILEVLYTSLGSPVTHLLAHFSFTGWYWYCDQTHLELSPHKDRCGSDRHYLEPFPQHYAWLFSTVYPHSHPAVHQAGQCRGHRRDSKADLGFSLSSSSGYDPGSVATLHLRDLICKWATDGPNSESCCRITFIKVIISTMPACNKYFASVRLLLLLCPHSQVYEHQYKRAFFHHRLL